MMTDFLVNFLIVGTQKGGTTALAKFLSQHPEICFAPCKEVHFFDAVDYNPELTHSQLNQQYQQAFPNWQGQHLVGEATPIYMYLPFVAERIYHYNPQMKLIFLLRNPVERAISHYNMELSRGQEWLPLGLAVVLEKLRLWLDRHNLQEKSSLRCHSYVDRGFYSQQILRMQQYFPPEQMLFINTKDLWHNHQENLQKIYGFLGLVDRTFIPTQELILPLIPTQELIPYQKSNKSSFINKFLTKTYLQSRFKKTNSSLANILGWNITEWNR